MKYIYSTSQISKSVPNNMVAIILKYKSDYLIILYYCTYPRLLNTIGIVIWNSMRLIKDAGFGP